MTASFLRRAAAALAGPLIALAVAGCSADDEAAAPIDPEFAAGARVYAERCASCHGADLRGTDKGPSHLSIVYEPGHHSDDSFRQAIAVGTPQHHWPFGDMQPVEGLTDQEVEDVIAFIRSEQERLGFE